MAIREATRRKIWSMRPTNQKWSSSWWKAVETSPFGHGQPIASPTATDVAYKTLRLEATSSAPPHAAIRCGADARRKAPSSKRRKGQGRGQYLSCWCGSARRESAASVTSVEMSHVRPLDQETASGCGPLWSCVSPNQPEPTFKWLIISCCACDDHSSSPAPVSAFVCLVFLFFLFPVCTMFHVWCHHAQLPGKGLITSSSSALLTFMINCSTVLHIKVTAISHHFALHLIKLLSIPVLAEIQFAVLNEIYRGNRTLILSFKYDSVSGPIQIEIVVLEQSKESPC